MGRGPGPQNNPCGADADYVVTIQDWIYTKHQITIASDDIPRRLSRSLEEILGSRKPGPQSDGQPVEVHTITARLRATDLTTATGKQQPRPQPLSLIQLAYQNPETLTALRSRWRLLEPSRSKPPSGQQPRRREPHERLSIITTNHSCMYLIVDTHLVPCLL